MRERATMCGVVPLALLRPGLAFQHSPSTQKVINRMNTTPQILIDIRQAAELVQVSERKLWSMSSPRGPIPVVRVGKLVRYNVESLRAWAERQEQK